MNILSLIGISNAYADAAAPAQGSSWMSFLPMLIILVLFMYFLVIRPQSKRAKAMKALMESLKVGDEVITTGGIVGRIEKLSDNIVVLNIAENVNISIQKAAIISSVPKGTMQSL
jgi:preprotein translocase subunit YajC